MFADRLEIVAAIVATLWLALAVATVVARRLPVPRLLVRTDVLVAGGATVPPFGSGAALADHVDDAGERRHRSRRRRVDLRRRAPRRGRYGDLLWHCASAGGTVASAR